MPEENRNQGSGEQGGETPTWETVLAGLTEAQRALYEGHTQGLRGALKTERGQRQDLAGQLKAATGKLEEGSEARDALEKVTGQLELATKRADFVTAAVGAGVRDAGLAWLAAVELDAFNRKGEPDFAALKGAHPGLFGQAAAAKGNAGDGTGSEPGDGGGMNAFIRKASGVG